MSNRAMVLLSMALIGALAIIGVRPLRAADDEAVLRRLAAWDESRVIDLTHAFYPGMPHQAALGDEVIEPLFAHEPGVGRLGSGAKLDRYSLVGQWGTHVDAPIHFVAGMRGIDEIAPGNMVLALVVLDVHEAVEGNPDYAVTMDDVRRWERLHGQIPPHAFVALRTDWSKRWPDSKAFFNLDADGVPHYPGWSLEVLKYVDEDRDARGIGHETPDTDPGRSAEATFYELESWHLRHDRFQLEMLTNLDRVPESGAVIIATWPKARGASGFPARALALIPQPETASERPAQ